MKTNNRPKSRRAAAVEKVIGEIKTEAAVSTAVFITGNVLALEHTFESQHWHIYRKLVNPHFFVVVADATERLVVANAIGARHENYFVHIALGPVAPVLENIPRLYQLKKLWAFFKNVRPAGIDPQLFVHCSADAKIQSCSSPGQIRAGQIITPWFGNDHGINPHFALMGGPAAAAIYLSCVDPIKELLKAGCPPDEASLLAGWLETAKVPVSRTMDINFHRVTENGTGRVTTDPYTDILRYVGARQSETPEWLMRLPIAGLSKGPQ